MGYAVLFVVVLGVCVPRAAALDCFDNSSYTGHRQLAAVVEFWLHWRVVDNRLFIALDAATTGWLGFGFAEPSSGHMKGSDMVTAAVTDGAVLVTDAWADFAPSTVSGDVVGLTPITDVHNDWRVEGGEEANGRTVVQLSRLLDTGDTQDRVVVAGDNRVVFAYGTASDTVSYHGARRGALSIAFFGSEVAIPPHDGVWEFRVHNYTVPAQVTTYACQSFVLPTDRRRHVVAVEPLLFGDPDEHPHHAVLHTCAHSAYFDEHQVPAACGGLGGRGDSPLGDERSQCSGVMWAWAIGMGPTVFPPEAGLPAGPDAVDAEHVILEIHYDNPALVADKVDTSGVRLYYVDTPRRHDVGGITFGDPLLLMGSDAEGLGPLPSGQSLVQRQASCPSSCTSRFTEPLHVVSVFSHMHGFGHKMYTSVYDDGNNFRGFLNRVDFWDVEHQQSVPTTFTIHPGDRLHTSCWYDTSATDTGVRFATGSADEMCMAFAWVYPRQFKGVREDGTPEALAVCGLLAAGGLKASACGGVRERSLGVVSLDPQVADPQNHFADPARFGVANRGSVPPAPSTAGCAPSVVQRSMRLSGVVHAALTDAAKAAVSAAFVADVAAALDVAESQVEVVQLQAGSVVVVFQVTSPSVFLAADVAATLAGADASVLHRTVAAVPAEALDPNASGVTVALVPTPAPSTQSSSPSWLDAHVIAVAVAASVVTAACVAVAVALYKRQPKRQAVAPAKPGGKQQVAVDTSGGDAASESADES